MLGPSVERFRPRLPGACLYNRADMKLHDFYSPVLSTAEVTDTIAQAARKMDRADIGSLAVFDRDRLVGIITERDLVRALGAEDPRVAIQSYVSGELRTADVDDDSREVARRMLEQGIRHLPVLSNGELVGIVSMRDLVALESR
jgi:CBS domain-containing protein